VRALGRVRPETEHSPGPRSVQIGERP
jgi:hypothetical protein